MLTECHVYGTYASFLGASFVQVAWALGTAMLKIVDGDDDLKSMCDSLPPQLRDAILNQRPAHPDLVTRCEDTWIDLLSFLLRCTCRCKFDVDVCS